MYNIFSRYDQIIYIDKQILNCYYEMKYRTYEIICRTHNIISCNNKILNHNNEI